MSHVLETTNLGLSKFRASDRPTWTGDITSDNEKVDSWAGEVNDKLNTHDSTLTNHESRISANETNISNLQSDMNEVKTELEPLKELTTSVPEVTNIEEYINYVIQNNTATITSLVNSLYPVGSVYISVEGTFDPNTAFSGTVWTKLQDRFLVGAGNTYELGATGGSADAVVVQHSHSISVSGGSGSVSVSGTTGASNSNLNHYHNMYDETTSVKKMALMAETLPNASPNVVDKHVAIDSDSTFIAPCYNYGGEISNWGSATATGSVTDAGATLTAHTHNFTGTGTATITGITATVGNTGVSGTNANLPPYLAVNMWKRVS